MLKSAKSTLTLLGAVAVLAGCGSAGAGAGSAAPPMAAAAHRTTSWMTPGVKNTSLLYVSNAGSSNVTVYTYLDGNGLVLVGTLTGFSFPTGMCTDSAGNVWIPDYDTGKIEEFAHGGTSPIFSITQRNGHPYDCAVDPSTGNIAVAAQFPGNRHGENGQVFVYLKGARKGSSFQPQNGFSEVDFLAYDNKSNLYVDGAENNYGNAIFRLPKDSAMTPLTISGGTLYSPGAVNWIKPTLLVGDANFENQGTPGAYKLFISGSTATVVGTLPFAGTEQTYGFSRRATRVIVPDHLGNVVRIYNLSNGTLDSKLTTGINLPFGAVVSQ